MNTVNLSPLAEKIAEVDAKLDALGREIEEIGMPAAYDLKRRYDALRVEDNALKRNFEESVARGEPDAVRLGKIEALLHHIETEEASVEREAHFLHQSNPSSVTLAAQAANQMVELWRRALKKVLGDSHPLGQSVFVNHTHENLADDYGLEREKPQETKH
ncbi:hypothetical protein OKA04_20935 [Luteolibacter flavescens]|uniref:Uncharacterized protein n=1 Tax=Luteolibacter flavescens TaxID=1859460 RepID=A0ABT3FUF2_9BACT|nr:hypothetical protein [Luteolibacter flavescens]MCW1887216.1 hypothetical protein [Luteolibacter flavescens]